MDTVTITVGLAKECHHLEAVDKEQKSIIQISKKYSLQKIIDLVLESWGIKIVENRQDGTPKEEEDEPKIEYILTIESIDGKNFHYKCLDEETISQLKHGKDNLLQLQFSPVSKALLMVNELQIELTKLNPKDEGPEEKSQCQSTVKILLQYNLLNLFRTLSVYTQDPLIVKELIELEAFDLVLDYLYLPIFQDSIKEDKQPISDISSNIARNVALIRSNSVKKKSSITKRIMKIKTGMYKRSVALWRSISLVEDKSKIVHLDNSFHSMTCISYALKSMTALIAFDLKLLYPEARLIGLQVSHFLEIDENYHSPLPFSITQSCIDILTAVAKVVNEGHDYGTIVDNEGHDNETTARDENMVWFRIESLLELPKRQPRFQIEIIKCFNEIYSLSSDGVKQEMLLYFNKIRIKNPNSQIPPMGSKSSLTLFQGIVCNINLRSFFILIF